MEFKPFPKIERIGKMFMQITQKIHGTNAKVCIVPLPDDIEEATEWMKRSQYTIAESNGKSYAVFCGSRTRWITPEDDNYGFARFVHTNLQEFVDKLGVGEHNGEWAGYGINSGEGLAKERKFVLFDFWKYPPERQLPTGCVTVPVLYQGVVDFAKIQEVAADLKANGSKLATGFMRPEGVVINLSGERHKLVFDAEETKWKDGDQLAKSDKDAIAQAVQIKYGHLFQPIRLEKLLSRDERFVKDFPKSLPIIADAYIADLIEEKQLTGDETDIKLARKEMGGQLFRFLRLSIEQANQ